MEPEHEDEPAKIITVHKELDDDTWNLKSVFEEYFPSLQRRSALVTLFSFFEHELDALCKRIQLQENSRLALADMAGKGIHRSTTYLSKVCDIAAGKGNRSVAPVETSNGFFQLDMDVERAAQ